MDSTSNSPRPPTTAATIDNTTSSLIQGQDSESKDSTESTTGTTASSSHQHHRSHSHHHHHHHHHHRSHSSSGSSASNNIIRTNTGWFQRRINLRPVHRGCHLVTDEVVKQVPEMNQFQVGICHLHS